MAKGSSTITPFLLDSSSSLLRRRTSSGDPSSSTPTRCNTAPNSTASSVFPYLRRLDIADQSYRPRQHHSKSPLLTLRLSASSFLDCAVHDDFTQAPLYIISTSDAATTISRTDPWEGSSRTAEIRWRKTEGDVGLDKGKGKQSPDGAMVSMAGGRWRTIDTFLKAGSLVSSRKFNIPDYPRTLKWKRVGSSYHCTTASVKGPVATLDADSSLSLPPRIRVFEAFHERYTSRPQWDHGGVSIALLDHLLVSALLLTTAPDAFLRTAPPQPPTSAVTASSGSIPDRQWRKIVYGEPLYPSLRASSPGDADVDFDSSSSLWDADGASQSSSSPTPAIYADTPPHPPPVPALPEKYQTARRGLPRPPLSPPSPPADPEQPYRRPRSTPPIPPRASHSRRLPQPPPRIHTAEEPIMIGRMEKPRRSSAVFPRSLPATPAEKEAAAAAEAEAGEHAGWMARAGVGVEMSGAVEAPPPAYNAIDFSLTHARVMTRNDSR